MGSDIPRNAAGIDPKAVIGLIEDANEVLNRALKLISAPTISKDARLLSEAAHRLSSSIEKLRKELK